MPTLRLLVVVLLLLVGQTLHAQAPPAAPTAAPPPSPATSAGGFGPAGRVTWTRSITLSGSFDSGPFKQGDLGSSVPGLTGKLAGLQGGQRAFQGSINIKGATNLHSVDVASSYVYAMVQPFGKMQDIPKFSVDYNFRQDDTQRYFFFTRFAWYNDDIRNVEYSHQALGGLGIQARDTQKTKMTLSGAVGTLHEKKGLPEFDGRWLTGWAGFERVEHKPNPYVELEQHESWVQAFNDPEFRLLESYVGVKAQVTKLVGVQFTLTHMYDNAIAKAVTVLPIPGVGPVSVLADNRNTVTTMAGVQIKF